MVVRAKWIVILAAVTSLLICATSADAIVFKFAQGERAGSASFARTGDDLVIVLTNTSTYDVVQPDQLLNAVFFRIEGNPVLTPVSALLTPGSTILFSDSPPPDGNVGGEWAYKTNLFGDSYQGISSTGLDDVFGPKDLFPPGINLEGPLSPGGLNYGLTSPWDDPTVGNSKVTGPVPIIKNSVTFVLDDLPTDFDPSTDITNVWFQYGTSQCEPRYPGYPPVPSTTPVPEPITATGLLLGLAALGRYVRRKRH
jgi:PEP-CTERM motif